MKRRIIFLLAAAVAVISALVLSCSESSTTGPDDGGDDNKGCQKPSAPSVIMLSVQSTSSIRLEWVRVDDAESYIIYRADSKDGKYSRVGTVSRSPFTDTALTSSTEYFYKISVENECGEGAQSNYKSETTMICQTASAPQNVSATAVSPTIINVSWGKVLSLAASYTVYHSTSDGGTYDSLANTRDTFFTHTGLSPASTHYYRIAGRDSTCGNGARSSSATATTTSCTLPSKPTSPAAAVQSATSIRITWDAVQNADRYIIYRATGNDGKYPEIDTVETRIYTNTGLSASTTYSYRVSAVNDCGVGEWSSYVEATTSACPAPAAPTNVSAEALPLAKVKISWNEVNTAVTYKIYRSTSSTGTYTPVGSTTGKMSTTWTDEGLEPATTYYYKVTAESECDESPLANSGYVVATTQCNSPPPAAPTNIKAEALSSTEIKISWDAVSGMTTEDNYLLYRSESRNGTYIYATGTSGIYQSMTITSFSPSTTYYFKMKTQNDCGESELSTSFDSATTEACDLPIPPHPTGIIAEALSARSVQVSWDEVEGAASYDVYRSTARGSMFWTVSGGRGLTETSFKDTTVSASTTYYYTVKSINSCGGVTDGLGDEIVEAITLCETPIPTNVSAAPKSPSSIEITWNEVIGAVSYSVYRASTANGTYTLIDRTADNSSTDTGLESLTTYHYKVTAKTALCDESQMSVSVFGTTPTQ